MVQLALIIQLQILLNINLTKIIPYLFLQEEIKRLIKSDGVKINDELYKNSNLSLKEYVRLKEIKISIGKKKIGIVKII